MGFRTWFRRPADILLSPEWVIRQLLLDEGVEMRVVEMKGRRVWVLGDAVAYYTGQSLREAVRDWLGSAGGEFL